MKILGKYAISGFTRPFLLSLAVFSLFMFFGAAFEKLGFFSRAENGVTLLFKFLAFQMPFFISMIIPLAALLGVLFLISEFMATGQWKALMAGGYRPFDIIKPVILSSVFIASFHFIFNESVMAPSFMLSRVVYNEQLKGDRDWRVKGNSDGSFMIKGAFIKYSGYDPSVMEFRGVLVEFYDAGSGLPLKKMKAAAMSWNGKERRWILKKSSVIEYSAAGVKAGWFNSYPVEAFPPPRELVTDSLVDNGTGFLGLVSRISRMKKMGMKVNKELIALSAKIARPFSTLVMVLIGCAIMLSGLAPGKILNIGIAVFTGFFFWGFTVMSERMAQIGVLGPVLGCFLPHLVFLAVSLVSLKRSRAF